MGRDETQAAYFALLRAREELESLQRYAEELERERSRLRELQSANEAAAQRMPPKLGRHLRHTDEALSKAIELRLRVVADELRRVPERLAAAQAFVDECEQEHDRLRRSA